MIKALLPIVILASIALTAASCPNSNQSGSSTQIPLLSSNVFNNEVIVDAGNTSGVINPNLIGADGPGPQGAFPVKQMRAIGLKFVRLDVGFENTYNGSPVYNCQTGQWNPTQFNQNINEVKLEGAQALAIVDYTPPCLANATTGNLTYAMPDKNGWSAWDSLVYQMALDEIPNKVRIYEVWNEPDGMFFTGGLQGYLQLYQHTVDALEKAATTLNTQIMVGGPGLAWWDPGWMQPFLQFVAENNLPLNFLSWHWYADDPDIGPFPPGLSSGFCLIKGPLIKTADAPCYYNPNLSATIYQTEVNLVSSYLSKYPQLSPILWIDEWNANAGFDERMNTSFDAAFAAEVLSSVKDDQNLRMCFFNEVDTPNDPDGNWGMVHYPTDTPKPVYYAFYFWHLLSGNMVSVNVTNSNPVFKLNYLNENSYTVNSNFDAVASFINNTYKLELINFEPYDPSGSYGSQSNLYNENVTIKFENLAKKVYSVSLAKITYNQIQIPFKTIGVLNGHNGVVSMKLPSESVYLITLTPLK